jgi:phage shock protein A
MSFFSRLTDIVTCNLSELLANEANRDAALAKIISEMEEGLAGANRSVKTASAAEQRLTGEIAEQKSQIEYWSTKAKQHLQSGDENQARLSLVRKREVEDVTAGLQQQHKAAVATRDHLTTTLRALEARLAEARRRLQTQSAEVASAATTSASSGSGKVQSGHIRDEEIEAELEALKRELGQNK